VIAALVGCGAGEAPTSPDFAKQALPETQDRYAVAQGQLGDVHVVVQMFSSGSGANRQTSILYQHSVGGVIDDVILFLPIPSADFVTSANGPWSLSTDIPGRGRIDITWANPGSWVRITERTGQWYAYQEVLATGTIFGQDVGHDAPLGYIELRHGRPFSREGLPASTTP
jgi:hypothetical protein